jgi:hypothetical protein
LLCASWGNQFPPPTPTTMTFCLTTGPGPMEPRTMNWNLWNCEQNQSFLLEGILSGILVKHRLK